MVQAGDPTAEMHKRTLVDCVHPLFRNGFVDRSRFAQALFFALSSARRCTEQVVSTLDLSVSPRYFYCSSVFWG